MALVKLGVAAIGPFGPSALTSLYTPDTTNQSGTGLLLHHLRLTIKATLPEITEVPDTVFAMPVGTDGLLSLPFMPLIGRPPRPADSAVNDTTQILPIDFVYVHRNVIPGVLDVQAYERDRLLRLQRALMADYRQGGTANATRVATTPLDHLTEYQMHFADDTQPVTVMVLTMEFDIIEPQPI